MIKNFVLDTNVLIHNPLSIYSFADNNVVIPIMVIEELDQLKNQPDKKGMHARAALREIDSLIRKGALKKGAKLKNNGRLIIAFGSKKTPKLPNMDVTIKDNKIIQIALEFKQKKQMVFFISKDVNARIKAEALGIKAQDYEKEKVEYSRLYKGWKQVTLKKEDIDKFYREHYLEAKGYSFFENEYVLLRCAETGDTKGICKYDSVQNRIIPMKKDYYAMGIHPLNMEQRFAFDLLFNDNIKLVSLVGQAGTGKTLLAIATALAKVFDKDSIYDNILVARPIMPLGRDIGYLPGTKERKLYYWMQPIYDNLDFILKSALKKGKSQTAVSELTLDSLLQSEKLEIEALTYIRGRSIPNQFLIIDEAQNLTPHEVKTIISRVGEGSKIVLTGDPEQIDNPYLDANSNGLSYTVESMKNNRIVGSIFLSKSERSEIASLAVEKL
jgi:PhoH-like ATPase